MTPTWQVLAWPWTFPITGGLPGDQHTVWSQMLSPDLMMAPDCWQPHNSLPAPASHYGLCLTIRTLGWTHLLVISHPQEEALEALLRSLVFFWTVLHVGRIFSPYRPSALKPAPPAQSPRGQPRTDACTAGNHTWSSWPFGLWSPSYKPGSTIQLEHTPVCPSQVTCPSWAARF